VFASLFEGLGNAFCVPSGVRVAVFGGAAFLIGAGAFLTGVSPVGAAAEVVVLFVVEGSAFLVPIGVRTGVFFGADVFLGAVVFVVVEVLVSFAGDFFTGAALGGAGAAFLTGAGVELAGVAFSATGAFEGVLEVGFFAVCLVLSATLLILPMLAVQVR
jgi:hypothetical protein